MGKRERDERRRTFCFFDPSLRGLGSPPRGAPTKFTFRASHFPVNLSSLACSARSKSKNLHREWGRGNETREGEHFVSLIPPSAGSDRRRGEHQRNSRSVLPTSL